MYDNNGLELTPMNNTMNAYKFTSVDLTTQRYRAYARYTKRFKDDWNMLDVGRYKDARDAAYVAQEFAKKYTPDQVKTMYIDQTFTEIAREFRENISIPEWKYPAEGLDFDDILGGKYTTNYVDNAKDALIEAIRISGKKPPALSEMKKYIDKVEALVKTGLTYRMAAREVMENA